MIFIPTLIAAVVLPQSSTYSVSEVNDKLVFAGKYGQRVITELTLATEGKTVHVTLADIRHDRFQPLHPLYTVGEKLIIPALSGKSDAVLFSYEIHRVAN